ncbi:FxsB family cyclophane-forming radical SAM/SPASM peptide maturase [Actinomadura roseirufa]|uniref:FxsB family cyclophane-forming radical SAM/SPASM peptide maturase n=1 Tax=Actinomadura roseirufa TaxID=2094049 RepID=UPI0010413EC0|nr:FxsB family cyclophane-forming radical SAM/SPASM peptide maturase [Actinomadura roseirufa]
MTTGVGRGGPDAEWPASLDVPALRAAGWRPSPFREFVLKVHARCDLACDYCYVFAMADQGWRDRPAQMPREVVDAAAARIGEHVRAHGLDAVRLVLHGGEPLLADTALLARAVRAVRAAAGGAAVEVAVQTNGTRLDEERLAALAGLDVRVGVSLDGDAAAQDRHRRLAGGRGSHARVAAGLGRLTAPRFRHLFAGLLCTIDLRNDPVATYEALLAFAPPRMDFLLPHGTWDAPPPGRDPAAAGTPYAGWLLRIFDAWYPAGGVEIRLFAEILQLLLGGRASSELLGVAPIGVAVVETDGSIEHSDLLKAVSATAPATGLHVARDSFDAVLAMPMTVARQLGVDGLCDRCRACRWARVCGGGLYAHRYRSGTGYLNPSVYCPDLLALIDGIHARVAPDLAFLRRESG